MSSWLLKLASCSFPPNETINTSKHIFIKIKVINRLKISNAKHILPFWVNAYSKKISLKFALIPRAHKMPWKSIISSNQKFLVKQILKLLCGSFPDDLYLTSKIFRRLTVKYNKFCNNNRRKKNIIPVKIGPILFNSVLGHLFNSTLSWANKIAYIPTISTFNMHLENTQTSSFLCSLNTRSYVQ